MHKTAITWLKSGVYFEILNRYTFRVVFVVCLLAAGYWGVVSSDRFVSEAHLYVPLVRVMYQLADAMERDCTTGLQQGTIPGLSALEALSGHLVLADVEGRPRLAAAHVNAMSRIAEQYAAY